MRKSILIGIVAIVVLALGIMVWEKTHPAIQHLQSAGFSIPADWKEYRNTELHFAFSYPPKLGDVFAAWDTYPGITGNEFGGQIAPKDDPNNPQFLFGSSSPDYNGNGVEARSTGFADQIQDLETFTSNDFFKIIPIESNHLYGKLVVGTGKCEDAYCLPAYTGDPAHPAYLAVFSLPENTKGLKVIGLQTYSEPRDEFLEILSTFKEI